MRPGLLQLRRLLPAVLLAVLLLASRGLAAQEPAAEPLALSLQEAVLTALERNPALRVERLKPALRATYLLEEQGSLDPVVSAEAAQLLTGSLPGQASGAEAGLGLGFATGTSLGVSVSAGWAEPWPLGADIEVTQALLAGGRVAANRARVEQARLELFASRHELRGFAEALAAEVESAYWEHYLALRQLEITRESLGLAERQLEEARVRVEVGRIAGSELAAPRAEVVSRRAALREGEKRVLSTRQALFLLVNPAGAGPDTPLRLLDRPAPPAGPLEDPRAHISLGLRRRPDLAQARLELQRGELEVVRTRAGLLPRLDLFARLGGTAYADSLELQPYASAGLVFQLPLGNRAARARAERARLSRTQAEEALRALELNVEADISNAWREAQFAAEGIASSAELRALQEQKLAAEVEKFRNGSSTTYLVAQAQRDLLSSQLDEARAAVAYLLAVISLYRRQGTLLERSGLELPEAAAE